MTPHLPILALSVLVFLALACPARAQTAGDACSASGASVQTFASGQSVRLVCNGTTWQELARYQTGNATTPATTLKQVGYDGGACNAQKAGRLSFNTATQSLCYCNGTSWTLWQGSAC